MPGAISARGRFDARSKFPHRSNDSDSVDFNPLVEQPMFLEFYKLREQPFGVTPDPRFLYFGSTHREALASLLYSVETKRGFSALVAEPGMGKTSLLFHMLDSLRSSARTAFLFQTDGDSRDLLRSLLHDLGINLPGDDRVSMREALNAALLQEMQDGKGVVVVIDEAQNLDAKVLESIRLLSNFETSTQKLMHIVLAGQPGLAQKLAENGMTQLRQRVSTIIRLEPFRHGDTVRYIEHRLRAAGHQGPAIFSPEALNMIARISKGIPRNINSLCFQALSIGFATQSKKIGSEILREVVSDADPAKKSDEREIEWGAPEWVSRPAPAQPTEPFAAHGWDHAPYVPPRPHRGRTLAALACLAIVPVSIVALSDPKFGLSDTIPGQISGRLVNAVLASGDANADFMPAWPDKLKPPQAPPTSAVVDKPQGVAKVEERSASPDENSDRKTLDASAQEAIPVIASRPTTASELARLYMGSSSRAAVAQIRGLNPRIRNEYQTIPKGTRVLIPSALAAENPDSNAPSNDRRAQAAGFQANRTGSPAGARVSHLETLFEFALEHYGKSNLTIVKAIWAANPQVRGPYEVLSPGQWIRLPSDLATAEANSDSRSPAGGHGW
jgi:general secretion pathway protein A